jgi:tRNA nucleotidyltransferase (CCA-adding enzyme)
MQDPYFDKLQKIYAGQGFRLYIVGGTTRDLLLKRPYTDRDFVTDATPEEEKALPLQADFSFSKYGALRVRFEGVEIDVTTLRKEGDYRDFRHPGTVTFVKDPKEDYVRRDFTINALYLDEDYRLLDYCGGGQDLQNKLIRFIGDPEKRVQEDPLRIIRAERFATSLGFSIEDKTQAALTKYHDLLAKLNPEKVAQERAKGWRG